MCQLFVPLTDEARDEKRRARRVLFLGLEKVVGGKRNASEDPHRSRLVRGPCTSSALNRLALMVMKFPDTATK